MSMKEHMSLLGLRVTDKVTGIAGVVTSISFDLYGCVQAVVTPPAGKGGESTWFDVSRLKVKAPKPVMTPPDFYGTGPAAKGLRGPAEKPIP